MELTMATDANRARFEQQAGIIDPGLLARQSFMMVGAGAIGSFLAMTLGKMGATKFTIWDHDTIEEHNFANQMFPIFSKGVKKVDALASVINEYSGAEINPVGAKFDPAAYSFAGADFVISAVDNMDVRKMLFETAIRDGAKFFIDGRMGAQVMRVYSVDLSKPEEIEFYKRRLYPAAKAAPERCTEKTIIYTVLVVSGLLLNMIKKRLNGEKCPTEIVYDLVHDYYVPTITTPEPVEEDEFEEDTETVADEAEAVHG